MGVNLSTLKYIRSYLSRELKELYTEKEISTLAGIIIKTVLRGVRLHQLYDPDHVVSKDQASEITRLCEELKTGKPYQYVLGETTFCGCIIRVSPAVLIPRPETEELADLIINENKDYKGRITDFGTGSGCIAVALATNIPGALVTGIDFSEEALSISRENALLNNVRVDFRKEDIFSFNHSLFMNTGIIVSNPPYVRDSEKKLMNRNVLDFEPHSALFVSDSDPIIYYRALLEISEKILEKRGRLYFEINEAMGEPLAELISSSGYSEVEIIKDINERDRIIKATKNG